jgi:hypothetical protein
MTLDEGKAVFDDLIIQWMPALESIDNEADTRFKLIDKILCDVLGWSSLGDFNLERYGDSGFADYVLSGGGRDRMVVEAKRVGAALVGTQAKSTQYLGAQSAALKNAKDGLKQAQQYCVDSGTTFAVLSSGIEWIAFWAVREQGIKPFEGKVIVFPTLEAISQDFARFWDLFSKQAVLDESYKILIREAEGLKIQSTEILKPVLKSGESKFLPKSQLALDLDRIFKEFFSSMAGHDDPEMLAHCFVESKESKEADVNLKKIADTLLSRLEKMSSEEGEQLQRRLQEAVVSKRGEFVLIIGNKGAGKTTFVDRFFRLVLPPPLKESCVVIRADVGDSPGDVNSIVSWLDQKLLQELEKVLFDNGVAKNEQLQGIFYSEYCRWKDGPHKVLYATNKTAFKIKFGEYLENLRSGNVHAYIEQLLKDVVDNRKKMPCLVFDNTDHFSEAFQETVFQYAQSLFRSAFSFVICPITDRTIWELSKHGPLQSYDTTSFYLPVPAMKSVLEKRVNFIRKKLSDGEKGSSGEYFIGRGIRLSVQDIDAFAACIEEIFVANDGISRVIGGLTNYDTRRSLQLTQKIVTSPHIRIDSLVGLYMTDGRLPLSQRSLNTAILCGEANHYSRDANNFVLNLFEVQGDDITSPLLEASILKFFNDVDGQGGGDVQDSHASVEDVLGYFNSMGISQATVKRHLQHLAASLLLSAYDTSEEQIREDSRLRITPSGKIHCEWILGNSSYLTETALTTPLRSGQARDELVALWNAKGKKTREDWNLLVSKFSEYCLDQDETFVVVPSMASYIGQRSLREQFRKKWMQKDGNEVPHDNLDL